MNPGGRPIIVVDDQPEMCWGLEFLLKKSGLVCKTASCGREAIALLERQPFRMAFLDAKLPDFGGLELARRLRELDPGIPIVIISGYYFKDDDAILEAIESGLISAFIAKPFEHIEILFAIEKYAPIHNSILETR